MFQINQHVFAIDRWRNVLIEGLITAKSTQIDNGQIIYFIGGVPHVFTEKEVFTNQVDALNYLNSYNKEKTLKYSSRL